MSTINQQSMSHAELLAAFTKMQAELQAIKSQSVKKKAIKVSAGGLLTLSGYRQFPFSFYKSEILDILERKQEILDFITASDESLCQGKDDKRFEAARAAAKAAFEARA